MSIGVLSDAFSVHTLKQQGNYRGNFMIFVEQLPYWISHYGYLAIFILLMLGIVGLPIPDETLLTLVGYLVLKGELQFLPAFASAFAGALCGITASYFIGVFGGGFVVRKYGPFLHITDERLGRIHKWFDHIGKWSLVLGYFVPGVRHLIAIVAGTSGLRLPSFILFAYTGAFVWSVSFISAGYFLGKKWQELSGTVHEYVLMILAAAACIGIGWWLCRRWLGARRQG